MVHIDLVAMENDVLHNVCDIKGADLKGAIQWIDMCIRWGDLKKLSQYKKKRPDKFKCNSWLIIVCKLIFCGFTDNR